MSSAAESPAHFTEPRAEPRATRHRAIARAVLDVIFPRWCVHCHEVVEPGPLEHLCADCTSLITFVREPHCSTCGQPFLGKVEGTRRCPTCVELDPAFDEGRTGALLDTAARQFVLELKYRRGWHLRGDLRVLLRQMTRLTDFVRGATLVPVPLHPRRYRWRGFNQAQWVAEALAEVAGETRVENLLSRIKDTPTQTRLNREARAANMKNAFALRPGAVLSSQMRYIIVDDVFTTGATLNACAEVLRKAGAEHLDVASFGHG